MRLRTLWCALGGAIVVTVALSGATSEPLTERINVDSAGSEVFGFNVSGAISRDGRFVAFASAAPTLVTGDTNFAFDVFVRDRLAETTERVSVDSAGNQANGHSGLTGRGSAAVAISEDGSIVAFASVASNLVSDDTNQVSDVFVHDRSTHRTERVSIGAEGQGNGVFAFGEGFGAAFSGVAISANGRIVAFDSYAPNLVAGDTNGANDVFVHDRDSGQTERMSVDSAGRQLLGGILSGAENPAISADGRFVGFVSQAGNLVANDTIGAFDVFVRDREARTTERVSLGLDGAEANQNSGGGAPGVALSADGRFIAFVSLASNLVAGDTNEFADVFVRDRQEGTTERVNVDSKGGQANNHSFAAVISADGRFVAFASTASNLGTGDIALNDIFVRDRQTNTTELATVNTAGEAAQQDSGAPAISADGRFVLFISNASNLVEADTNGSTDVFIRDRGAFADTEPPLLTVPDTITVDAMSPAGAAVLFAASATDIVDPDVPVTCTPASGSTFPVGTTTVSCSATDDAGNTGTAAFDVIVRPFVVPFAAFLAEVEIEEPDEVEVKATFRLGKMSDGIQPASEIVTLRVGGFEVTIAAGSFVADDKGRFRFKGAVNGINLDARIRPLADGGFEFKASLPREALMPLGTQVEVSLTIGNDTGATTATVDVE